MSTVEKLFVQVFERKNSIIQRVKQQTDLYTQHLASKALADGITPPPWLWNPSQSSDVQKVLNKEELISEILLPHPQPEVQFPSAHCSKFSKQVVAIDNAELLVGLSKDINSYNRDDIRDRETVATSGHENNTRCTRNCVPEQDNSVNSPEDETEARISNIYSAPEHSLARIQRSRSRQKALELRYSGGAKAKSRSIQKNVSLDSSARNGQTIFASEKVDKVSELQEMVEPSVIRHGTYGVGELNEADNTNKEDTIAYATTESARLKGSGRTSSGVDSLKIGSCSGSIQRDDSAPVQHEEEFSKCVDSGTEFPEVTADSCGEARAEDFCVHMEKDAGMHDDSISQPSSYQQRCRQNEGPEVDISIRSAKGDNGILVQSTQQFDNSNVSEEITKPPECIDLERTRSTSNDEVLQIGPCTSIVPCHRDKVCYSRCKQMSLKKYELQRMSSGETIIVCADPWNISHQLTNTEAVDANELISHNFVKAPPVNSWSIIDHARSELLVSKNPSDCLTFLSPKQLLFDDSEECNLDKRFSLNLENRMTQKPSSSSRPGRSTETNEFCKDSLESTSEENMQLVEHSFSTHEHPILGTSYGDSVILPLAQNPYVESQTNMTHTKDCESSDLKDQIPQKCKEVCKSTPEVESVKGQFGIGDKSKGTSASNTSKRKYLMLDHDKWENDSISCSLTEFPLLNYQNHDLSKSEEIKFGKKSQLWKMRSWPTTKRRKIEDHESNSCSARVNFFCQTDHANRDFGKAGIDMENFVDHTSLMNESTNEEMWQKVVTESNEEMKPLTEPLNSEIVLCSGGLSEPLGSSSSDLLKVNVPILLSLDKEAARVSQDCLVKELETHADLEKDNDEKDRVKDNSADTDRLTCTERTTSERKLHLAEDGQLSQYLERYKRDLELNSINQSLPELEGFVLDSQSENEVLGFSGSQGNVHELVLQRTSLERVSILERICKSASQQAVSTEFSSFKLHGFHMPYRSVPNGLLECMDLSRISASSEDSIEAARSNDMHGPYAGLQLGCTFSPYTSPVGKQWDKTSLRSGSSGKTLSSNPELICFPIEEDPSVSEENENVAEESDKSQDDILSSINNVSLEQEPFADMTEAHLNTSSLVAASDKFLSKGCGNSDTNDARLNDNHREVKRNVGHPARDKSLNKENDILSLLGNGNKMSKPSLNSRFSKANSSCDTSSRKERRKLSEKEPKRNNIVSNVTSFIPLVQQKQAAAQGTGKKEIKVKALEAAVAAKRLEEKKANERKMRKEALRIEKARLEQENLKQLELEKKRKEEERKKRDADIAAKKRQREEEDKKEKERKKKRLEEARQQQREDGKLRLEKSKQLSLIGENDNRNKETNFESKKTQILLKETRNNAPSEKPYAKLRPNGSTNHIQDSDISIEACRSSTDSSDQRKTISPFNNSPNTDTMAAKKMQEKSYEISPYQCSDDEEEEEDEVPNKKFIPSWTSKSSVALLLPLQQGTDPDTIFPPDSFCSTEEVLLPRKPQHKQLAT